MTKHNRIQLSLPCSRSGRMGSLDLGWDYMAGVKARAAMLAKATRVVREPQVVSKQEGQG